ncbi:hypothetical protein [Alicyclobacillus acidocaldarius]|uniref:hypothetical protein n=1 Tax=Alicyclobacillus acidocaldarius TaxID=405212 RepID=UPI00019DDC61|nr:hypothetical protein [Alicyclobacillus acidocaldarius]
MRTKDSTSSQDQSKDKKRRTEQGKETKTFASGKHFVLKTRDKTKATVDYITGVRLSRTMDEFTATYRDIVVGLGDHVMEHEAWMESHEAKSKQIEEALQQYTERSRRLLLAALAALALSALSLTSEIITWVAK